MSHVPHRRTVLTWLAAAGGLALGACGRKARPIPPPDVDPLSPRRYPVDKSVAPQYRNVPPEFVPPPPDIPASPLQGPLYPAQPVPDPYTSPVDPIYQQ